MGCCYLVLEPLLVLNSTSSSTRKKGGQTDSKQASKEGRKKERRKEMMKTDKKKAIQDKNGQESKRKDILSMVVLKDMLRLGDFASPQPEGGSEFDFCHCLKCVRFFFANRKQREVCMGLSPKKGHRGCGLQAGSFWVRRSYPDFWTYYLKLLAHGYTHENAKWQAREAFELRREEQKNSGKVPEKARGAGRSPESTTDVGLNAHLPQQTGEATNIGQPW